MMLRNDRDTGVAEIVGRNRESNIEHDVRTPTVRYLFNPEGVQSHSLYVNSLMVTNRIQLLSALLGSDMPFTS